ncbi:hypothetical protein [Caulobacter sp.]|jgi:hypothetical protein|uniref:hypothetical protein n=1 Tax=Caulobacter sp. TaxID=78 RepID=UPI0031E25BCC
MTFARPDLWAILGLVSVAVWALSLFLPIGGGYTGMDVLTIGWLGVIIGKYGYLANLTVFLGPPLLILRQTPQPWSSLVLAVFTAFTGYFAVVWDGILLGDHMELVRLRPFGPTYYLWLLAVLVAGFAPLAREMTRRKP